MLRGPANSLRELVAGPNSPAPALGWRPEIRYVMAFGAGLAWTVALWMRSTGGLFDDEIGHFLLSRDSLYDLRNLLDLWGRPLNTLIYALPAQGGLRWARLLSIVLSAMTVLVATRLGEVLGIRRLYLVPALLWFQPWFSDLGYCVITEVPFSLWLMSGMYFWAIGRLSAASLFFGLLPLTRHEGIALTGLWLVYMLVRRKWRAASVTLLPMVIFNGAYLAAYGSRAFAIYLNPQRSTFYGHGDWFHFLRGSIYQAGKPIFALAVVGALLLARQKDRWRFFLGPLVYFVVHTVLYRFALYGSAGYVLFLLPVAPSIALAAALGLERIIETGQALADGLALQARFAHMIVATSASILITAIAAYGVYRTKPHGLAPRAAAMKEASLWLRSHGLGTRPIITTNVNFYYVHPLRVSPGHYWWTVPELHHLKQGTIVIWDGGYSDRWGLTLSALSNSAPEWRRLASFGSPEFAIIFEKCMSTGVSGGISKGCGNE